MTAASNVDGAVRPPSGGGPRRAARLAAVQALYELETSGGDVEDMIIDYQTNRPGALIEGDRYARIDADLFADVLRGAVRRRSEIDDLLSQSLAAEWPLSRLERILRDLLRCGVYELLLRQDVPARVVISEYMEVAHAFFQGEEPRLVNAVLDRIAHRLRAGEFGPPA